jgi:hypothetical protein
MMPHNMLRPLSEKCKPNKCSHKKCTCNHCARYHMMSREECLQMKQDLTTCQCKKFAQKSEAAQLLRAIPSEKRRKQSRLNGKKGGRPKKS